MASEEDASDGNSNSSSSQKSKPKFPCPFAAKHNCDKYFTSKSNATTHGKIHTGAGKIQCPDCDHVASNKSNLTVHRKAYHRGSDSEEESFPCPLATKYNCKDTFKTKESAKKHADVHTRKGTAPCPHCNHVASHKGNLNKHITKMHPDPSAAPPERFPCPLADQYKCDKTFATQDYAQTHSTTHSGIRYTCPKCNKSYTNNANMLKHLRTKHEESDEDEAAQGSVPCPYAKNVNCKKKFPDQSAADEHGKTHKGQSKFSCPVCQKEFETRTGLKDHSEEHLEEAREAKQAVADPNQRKGMHAGKGFPCPVADEFDCKARFTSKQGAERHVKQHKKKKTVPCPKCTKEVDEDYLDIHIKKVHGDKPKKPSEKVPCYFAQSHSCNLEYADHRGAYVHGKKHTGNKPYCSICLHVVPTTKALLAHERLRHPHRRVQGPRKTPHSRKKKDVEPAEDDDEDDDEEHGEEEEEDEEDEEDDQDGDDQSKNDANDTAMSDLPVQNTNPRRSTDDLEMQDIMDFQRTGESTATAQVISRPGFATSHSFDPLHDRPIECQYCQAYFRNINELSMHQNEAHPQRNDPGWAFSSAAMPHVRSQPHAPAAAVPNQFGFSPMASTPHTPSMQWPTAQRTGSTLPTPTPRRLVVSTSTTPKTPAVSVTPAEDNLGTSMSGLTINPLATTYSPWTLPLPSPARNRRPLSLQSLIPQPVARSTSYVLRQEDLVQDTNAQPGHQFVPQAHSRRSGASRNQNDTPDWYRGAPQEGDREWPINRPYKCEAGWVPHSDLTDAMPLPPGACGRVLARNRTGDWLLVTHPVRENEIGWVLAGVVDIGRAIYNRFSVDLELPDVSRLRRLLPEGSDDGLLRALRGLCRAFAEYAEQHDMQWLRKRLSEESGAQADFIAQLIAGFEAAGVRNVLNEPDFSLDELIADARELSEDDNDAGIYLQATRLADGRCGLKVGQTTNFKRRNADHNSAVSSGDRSAIYNDIRKRGTEYAFVPFCRGLMTVEERLLAEQMTVLLLQTYQSDVLSRLEHAELPVSHQNVTSVTELDQPTGESLSNYDQTARLFHKLAAQELSHVADDSFTASGWCGGVQRGTFGVEIGYNLSSPLFEAGHRSSTIWLRTDIRPGLSVFRRDPLAGFVRGDSMVYFLQQNFPLTLSPTTYGQLPDVDDEVFPVVEIMTAGETHPNQFMSGWTDNLAPWNDWQEARGVAIRLEWKDKAGEWRMVYVSTAVPLRLINIDVEGSLSGYERMLSLRQSLLRQVPSSVTDWRRPFALARVKRVYFNHNIQTYSVREDRSVTPVAASARIPSAVTINQLATLGASNIGANQPEGQRCDVCWELNRECNPRYRQERFGLQCFHCWRMGRPCCFTLRQDGSIGPAYIADVVPQPTNAQFSTEYDEALEIVIADDM